MLALALVSLVAVLVWSLSRDGDHEHAGDGAGHERQATRGVDRRGEHAVDPAPLASPTASVRGRVIDADQVAVRGALVCVQSVTPPTDERVGLPLGFDFAKSTACTRSTDDGRYTITGVRPRRVHVCASAPRKISTCHGELPTMRAVPLRASDTLSGVDIVMPTGAVKVTGTVFDLSGGVIEGALVIAKTSGVLDGVSRARSDARGDFSLWLRASDATVRASAPAYAPASAQFLAPGPPLALRLAPASSIRGTVVHADTGKVVDNALVSATDASPRSGPASTRQVRTDFEGHFTLDGLPPRPYRVAAVHSSGRGEVAAPVTLGFLDTVEGLTITLSKGVPVRGRVVFTADAGADADAAPCESGRVELYGGGHPLVAPIADGGAVEFMGVAPGAYSSQVFCDQAAPAGEDPALSVANVPLEDLLWSVRPGASARGRVAGTVHAADGTPVDDAE